MSNCNDSNATHHTGCACWEAKRDARIDQLETAIALYKELHKKADLDRWQALDDLDAAQAVAANLQAELDRCKEENERLRQRLGLEEKFWTVTVEE